MVSEFMMTVSPAYTDIVCEHSATEFFQSHVKGSYTQMFDEVGPVRYKLAFQPADQKLSVSKIITLDADVGALSNDIFSGRKAGLYNFTTHVDLSYNQFTEMAFLSGIPFDVMRDIPDDDIQRKLHNWTKIKALAKISGKLGIPLDDPKHLAEIEKLDQKFAGLLKGERVVENIQPLNAYPKDVFTQYASTKEDIQKTVDAAPLFIQIAHSIQDRFCNPQAYTKCRVTYYNEMNANNPFADFVHQLQKPDTDSEMAFYKLAGNLKNRL